MGSPLDIILIVAGTAVGIVVGIVVGILIRKAAAEKQLGSAEQQAKKLLEDAIKAAETKRKESTIAAKDEILALRKEFDAEVKERRSELTRQEQRLMSKEDHLDKKVDALEKKEEALQKKVKENEEIKEKLTQAHETQLKLLEKISGYSAEEARALLIKNLEDDVKHEQAQKLIELEAEFKEEADKKAKNIISLAIARCAADHVSEATISVVSIPNDDMKGRIIGREGRNVRAIENLTGVELIIDDTPEVITISGFDVRLQELLLKSLLLTAVSIRQGLRIALKRHARRLSRQLSRLVKRQPLKPAFTVLTLSLLSSLADLSTEQAMVRTF